VLCRAHDPPDKLTHKFADADNTGAVVVGGGGVVVGVVVGGLTGAGLAGFGVGLIGFGLIGVGLVGRWCRRRGLLTVLDGVTVLLGALTVGDVVTGGDAANAVPTNTPNAARVATSVTTRMRAGMREIS
jgi:hypothetical protein